MFKGLFEGNPTAVADLVWTVGIAIAIILLIRSQRKKKKKDSGEVR